MGKSTDLNQVEESIQTGGEEDNDDTRTDNLGSVLTVYLQIFRSVFEAMDCVKDVGVDSSLKMRILDGIIYTGLFVTDRIGQEIDTIMNFPYDKTGKQIGEIEFETAPLSTGFSFGGVPIQGKH